RRRRHHRRSLHAGLRQGALRGPGPAHDLRGGGPRGRGPDVRRTERGPRVPWPGPGTGRDEPPARPFEPRSEVRRVSPSRPNTRRKLRRGSGDGEDAMAQIDLSFVIPLAILAGLGFAGLLTRDVLRRDTGNDRMREITAAIQQGARAFLRRQYRSIAIIAVILAIVFAGAIFGSAVAAGKSNAVELGLKTAGAFALGAAFSALSGFIGMQVAIRTNVRSAAGSLKSFNDALVIALRGGAVSGLSIVGLSLAGVSILYYGYGALTPASSQNDLVLSIVGFGFGASLVALFAQLGGGIYTKAADVGADLVGKVEAGIPEDDPRNPAVIADLVGDNVGDCAGRSADLFESTAAENIGAMILGAGLATPALRTGVHFAAGMLGVMLFPLVARAFGLIASIVGVMAVRTDENADPMSALNRGYYIAAGLALL